MSQELPAAESNIPSTTVEAQTLPSSPKEQPKSFSAAVYYGVPFDELLGKDISTMSHDEQRCYLEGIRSARVNPGHKKVEKSTGARTKGKGSETSTMLKGLI